MLTFPSKEALFDEALAKLSGGDVRPQAPLSQEELNAHYRKAADDVRRNGGMLSDEELDEVREGLAESVRRYREQCF